MRNKLFNPITMLCAGLALGVISRLLDIYTQNLGEIFSQLAIWILLGTLISVFSESTKKAMLNVLLFCFGMLITYYAVAVMTDGVYSVEIIVGWTVFALFSPVLAFFVSKSKGRGLFPVLIRIGVVAVSVLSSDILFDRLRIYDFVIDGILIYVLFFMKIKSKR